MQPCAELPLLHARAEALATAEGALRRDLTDDGIHLNGAGYAAVEPVMLRALGAVPD